MSKAEILEELPKLTTEDRAEIQARLDELAGQGSNPRESQEVIFALDILPAAIADPTEAARWYEGRREGLGIQFAREINGTIDCLADQAMLFRVRYRRKNVRWVFPRRFPYRICYYVEVQTVHVFAVVHAARDDREWRSRLRRIKAVWSVGGRGG
jgi:toxin ParE1/3/4